MAKKKINQGTDESRVITCDFRSQKKYNVPEAREENMVGIKISEARRHSGLTLANMVEKLKEYGVTVQLTGISKWESGVTVPNAYQLIAISQALNQEGGLSYFDPQAILPPPILNESGMRKVDEYKADLVASGRYSPRKVTEFCRYVDMKISTLCVSAGTGSFLDEGHFEVISFPENTVPNGADFGIRVSGDSMEPVYHDGQIAWVQQCAELAPGEIGIFVYDGDGYIKQYDEREPDETQVDEFTNSYGEVRMQPAMISYNKKYHDILVSPNKELCVVGRVLN